MITPVTLPKLTLTMEGASLIRWLKQEGDNVEKEEVLLELETDKAVVEISSPSKGILRKIVVSEGQVPVGAILGFVGDLSDVVPEANPCRTSPAGAPGRATASPEPEETLAQPLPVRATPAAR